ncbi:MAG: YraN family protein [Nocardioidaceae bacterium]
MATTQAQRKALGDYGERVAARHLEQQGMTVVDRNWRCSDGEIDIVAREGRVLVVCEVKTRSSDRYGSAFQAITAEKARRLHHLGHAWASAHQCRCGEIRLDVVAVTAWRHGRPTVEHIVGMA